MYINIDRSIKCRSYSQMTFPYLPGYTIILTFKSLKGQSINISDNEIVEGISLDDLRTIVITQERYALVNILINLEWNESSEDSHIKNIIKSYLSKAITHVGFISMYNIFQSLMTSSDDILYYLNPLKFKGYEIDALNNIQINDKLDYTGLISACVINKIDRIVIRSFIDRFPLTTKYENLLNRKRANTT